MGPGYLVAGVVWLTLTGAPMPTPAELARENRTLRETVAKLKAANAKLVVKERNASRKAIVLGEELGRWRKLVAALPLVERRRLERRSHH